MKTFTQSTVILLIVAFTLIITHNNLKPAFATKQTKILRVGMIGLDTSHVTAFTKVINAEGARGDLAKIKVVAAYPGGTDIPASKNRVKGFTEQLREMGVEIVDSIPALLEKVDVVMLESVDGRPHLEQIIPVLKAGKRVYVDKPVAGSLTDAVAMYELAKHYKVKMFSSSSYRFHPEPQAIRNGKYGKVLGCTSHGPASIEPTHPDLFWYGIHTVEGLFTCMGTGCKTVTRTSSKDFDVVVGQWDDGRIGTMRGIRKGKVVSGGVAYCEKAVVTYKQSGGYAPMLDEIATFLVGGDVPVSPQETLEIYAFMEAADESKRQGGKPVSIDSVMKKAHAEAKVIMKKVVGE